MPWRAVVHDITDNTLFVKQDACGAVRHQLVFLRFRVRGQVCQSLRGGHAQRARTHDDDGKAPKAGEGLHRSVWAVVDLG